jgi:hypothetical protein
MNDNRKKRKKEMDGLKMNIASLRAEQALASVRHLHVPVRQEMKRVRQLAGASGGYVYSAAVSAARPPADYTARVIPHCDGVAISLEDAQILWQR